MKRIAITIALLWIAAVTLLCAITLWNLVHGKPSNAQSEQAFSRDWLHDELLAKCAFHDGMIHLCGGWARATGRKLCNGVVRSPDGMLLTTHMPCEDLTPWAQSLETLCADVHASGRKLLYVQLPWKIDRNADLLPRGFAQDFTHATVDKFLQELASRQVPFLDVRGTLDATPMDVKRHFFKTDHHWNFDGAFQVFPDIALALAKAVGSGESDIDPYVSRNAWQRKKTCRRFLGADGRRTGVLFAGRDEVHYYIPKFKTSIAQFIPSSGKLMEGSFEDAVIQIGVTAKPQSMLLDNQYAIYGYNLDYVRYMNERAPVKKRLLVVKDSFAVPIVAWLSTLFERMDVVDLRHFTQMTVLEAMDAFEPDVVAVMYNPDPVGSRWNQWWDFGRRAEREFLESRHPARDVSLPPSDYSYNHVAFEDGRLEAKGIYRISAKRVEITGGRADKATMALMDKQTGEIVKRQKVPLTMPEWIVEIPANDHEHVIGLYAGELGKCAGVGAVWHAVEVFRVR